MSENINVEVAFATPKKQKIIALSLPEGSNALDAIESSKICHLFQELQQSELQLGIYSQSIEPDQILKEGDRVEIYRPLVADPKEIRKRRAAEMAAKRELQKANKG